jgi:hypothetical protein
MPSFDQAYQKAISEVDKFNKQYDKTPYGAFGTAASNALKEFVNANAAFKNGDTLGGSAAVLRGIGGLSAGLVLGGGPAGAAVGAVLGAITGIIAAILEALKPASDSLLNKIEKLIKDETLIIIRNELVEGISKWELLELEIDNLAASRQIITKEYLNQNIPWKEHYGLIKKGFATLKSHAGIHSKEWMRLFELNVIYALRFWVYLEQLNLLFCKDRQSLPDPASHELSRLMPNLYDTKLFYNMRHLAAERLRDAILDIHFASINEVDIHTLYLSGYPYDSGAGYVGRQANSIYHRVGIIAETNMEDLGIGDSLCFEIASSGTIFSVGTNPYTLYVGRSGSAWYEVPWSNFGYDVQQVAIGEMGNDKIIVACVSKHGDQISFCEFDDRANTGHESKHHGWSPGDWRWGKWNTYTLPAKNSILSLAIEPDPPYWGVYAFVLESDRRSGLGKLCGLQIDAGQTVLKMKMFSDASVPAPTLRKWTWGILIGLERAELSPCTVTCLGKDLYLQVGNMMTKRVNGKWNSWDDLQNVLGTDIKVFQARPYADGTMIFATKQGLFMRYFDPIENTWRTGSDDRIQTIWFSKPPPSNIWMVRESLLEQVTVAANEPIERFLGPA